MEVDEYVPIKSNEDVDRGASTSRPAVASSSNNHSTPKEKVPKWFKPN